MLPNNQECYQTLGWIINQSEYGYFLVEAEGLHKKESETLA